MLLILVFMSVRRVSAGSGFSFHVGAKGDNASIGSMGAKADIRTHIYSITPPDRADAFWVGDNLDGEGFIQFGYQLQSGTYCLKGEFIATQTNCQGQTEFLQNSDPRWFWQYWPNAAGQEFYFGIGQSFSAGSEGSWHTYEMEPNNQNGWSFILDGQRVDTVQVAPVQSADPVYVDAEKVTTSLSPGSLGPVEFRDLEYLLNDGWHSVTALYMTRSCSLVDSISTSCNAIVPFGVDVDGPNFITAGSGMGEQQDEEILWPVNYLLEITSSGKIVVDGKYSGIDQLQLSLLGEQHTLSVPRFIEIDDNARYRFDHWSDGSDESNRTIDLSSDMSLTAIYVQQYLLTINSNLPTSGAGWYDVEARVSFSTLPSPQPTNDTLGQWQFDGWYEEGTVITTSSNGSILMDAPTTLEASWHVDYSVLELELSGIAIISVMLLIAFRKRSKKLSLIPVEQTFCIYCGHPMERTKNFCERCGKPAPRN